MDGFRALDLRHLALVAGDLGPLPGGAGGGKATTALTPDGRVAVTVSPAGLLRLWDWPELRLVASAEGPTRCAVAALDPDGARAGTGHGCLALLWALGEAPAVVARFGADQAVQAMAVAAAGAGPEGIDLVAGDVGGSLHRLRLVTP